jgi:hypothetical protein
MKPAAAQAQALNQMQQTIMGEDEVAKFTEAMRLRPLRRDCPPFSPYHLSDGSLASNQSVSFGSPKIGAQSYSGSTFVGKTS